jgi:rRNA biogenesis protein RRP5
LTDSILSVTDSKVELTLRTGELQKPTTLTMDNLEIGQKVEGTVKRVEEYGLFIQLQATKLSGLCHKSEV